MTDISRRCIFLFDVDGVLADTPHENAWFLAAVNWRLISENSNVFSKFYHKRVAGEPGLVGAKRILGELHDTGKHPYFTQKNINEPALQEKIALQFRATKQCTLLTLLEQRSFCIFSDVIRILLEAKNDGAILGVVSSSENAKNLLSRILIKSLIEAGPKRLHRYKNLSLFDLFDVHALGAITYWHGFHIDKSAHYAMAFGKALGGLKLKRAPFVIIFEDAVGGVEAAKKLGFCCVVVNYDNGSNSRSDFLKVGADLIYSCRDLQGLKWKDLSHKLHQILSPRLSKIYLKQQPII